MKKSKQKGFTLLELLLVVGIAAILIVAGITTYNLVNKSNQINETTRLVHTIMDQFRRLYAGTGTYAGTAAAAETALWNSGSVPARYRGATAAIGIITPFQADANAFTITPNGATFTVGLRVPPAYAPELAQNFNPGTSNDLVSIQVCGGAVINAANAANLSAAALSATCGGTTAQPAANNLVIIAR